MLNFFISNDSIRKHELVTIIDDLPKKNKKEVFIECTKDYAEMIGEEFCINKESLLNVVGPNSHPIINILSQRRRASIALRSIQSQRGLKSSELIQNQSRMRLAKKSDI